jgi:outer membrane protein OmpA-like peptidoglycan-associated protein
LMIKARCLSAHKLLRIHERSLAMVFLKMVPQTLLICVISANLGCAPSVRKPEAGSTSATSSAEIGKVSPGADQERSGVTQELTLRTLDQKDGKAAVAAPSSLYAMKEGKSTASSPTMPLKDAFFEFDRYELSIETREILKNNADWLKTHVSARIEVEGHSDERGTSEYNLALGAKRSQTARDYLACEVCSNPKHTCFFG